MENCHLHSFFFGYFNYRVNCKFLQISSSTIYKQFCKKVAEKKVFDHTWNDKEFSKKRTYNMNSKNLLKPKVVTIYIVSRSNISRILKFCCINLLKQILKIESRYLLSFLNSFFMNNTPRATEIRHLWICYDLCFLATALLSVYYLLNKL